MKIENELTPVCQRLLTPRDLAEILCLGLSEIQKVPIPRVMVCGLARWKREDVDAYIEASTVPYHLLDLPNNEATPEPLSVPGMGVPIDEATAPEVEVETLQAKSPDPLMGFVSIYREAIERHGPKDLATRLARTNLFSHVDKLEADFRLRGPATSRA